LLDCTVKNYIQKNGFYTIIIQCFTESVGKRNGNSIVRFCILPHHRHYHSKTSPLIRLYFWLCSFLLIQIFLQIGSFTFSKNSFCTENYFIQHSILDNYTYPPPRHNTKTSRHYDTEHTTEFTLFLQTSEILFGGFQLPSYW